jgi:UPF0755 protein
MSRLPHKSNQWLSGPRLSVTLVVLTATLLFAYSVFLKPPLAFPTGAVVTIPEGVSIREVASILKEARAINSTSFFSSFARLFGGESGVKSGSYALERPQMALTLAWRFAQGDTGSPSVKVFIPEGSTVRDIARIVDDALPGFDSEKFREIANKDEGYLFPDTYFFSPGTTPETVRTTLQKTFNEKIKQFEGDIALRGYTLHDVVTMASLLEKEARQYETKRVVAGILYSRLELGMALQVDAVFGYIFDTDTFHPTFEDLEADSPYNTYKYPGLPPGPITNPGLDSIRAALHPTDTNYLYYLTGRDGTMHYARTFDEHVENRRFLR